MQATLLAPDEPPPVSAPGKRGPAVAGAEQPAPASGEIRVSTLSYSAR